MSSTPLNPEALVQQSPTLKAAVLAGMKKGAKSDAEAVENYRASRDCIVKALPELHEHFAVAQPKFSVGGLTREAKAEVWDEGHKAGWEDRDEDVKIGWYGNYSADTKNPYES